jgi:HNH endonuclease
MRSRFVVWNGPLPFVGTDSLAEVQAFVRAGHSIAIRIEPDLLPALANLLRDAGETLDSRMRRRAFRESQLATDPSCGYCGRPLTLNDSTVDHVIPLSEGGADDESNWELCCDRCNRRKAARSREAFCAELAGARHLRDWLASRELTPAA